MNSPPSYQQTLQSSNTVTNPVAKLADQEKMIMVATIGDPIPDTPPRAVTVALTTPLVPPHDNLHVWLIDSAASSHLSGNIELFESIQDISPVTIQTASGESFTANLQGTIQIDIISDPDLGLPSVPITLTNVIYAPNLRSNLLSVGRMTNANVEVVFNKDTSYLMHRGHRLAYGSKVGNLFTYLAITPNLKTIHREVVHLSAEPAEIILWHHRLSHTNYHTLENMKKLGTALRFTPDVHHGPIPQCADCPFGKQTRSPFKKTEPNPTSIGDIVVSDLCGPFETSVGGYRYFVTWMDLKTRFTNIEFLKNKECITVTNSFKNYAAWILRQKGVEIKRIRTDNGGEYTGKEFENLCSSTGIIHETTSPYTPEHNGTTERYNRTLQEGALTIRHEADLSTKFWVSAIHTVNFVRNRVLHRHLGTSPYESFWGNKPSIDWLRTYGCKCWVLVPKAIRRKGEFKSIEGIFVGYYDDSKAYKIWIPHTRSIMKARDVIFDEANHIERITIHSTDDDDLPDLWLNEYPITFSPSIAPSDESSRDNESEHDSNQGIEETSQERRSDTGKEVRNKTHSGSIMEKEMEIELREKGTNEENEVQRGIQAKENNVEKEVQKEFQTEGTNMEKEVQNEKPNERQITGSHRPTVHRTRDFERGPWLDPDDQSYGRGKRHQALYAEMAALAHGYEELERTESAMVVLAEDEPANYREAITSVDAEEWRLSMGSEYGTLMGYNTWTLVPCPPDVNIVGSRWTYRIKRDNLGRKNDLKSRLVAQGFSQIPGQDFNETYSPTIRFTTIRLILALASRYDLELRQINIKGAYLNGILEEDIYMHQPEGFIKKGKEDMVCKLNKGIYGLKQSGRVWHQTLKNEMSKIGFTPGLADTTVFFRYGDDGSVNLAGWYIDDGLLASKSKASMNRMVNDIRGSFEIKDLGEPERLLGIKITRNRELGSIHMSQPSFINTIAKRFNITSGRAITSPMDHNMDLRIATDADDTVNIPYASLVGSINYCAVSTRPDIAYATNKCAQFTSKPTITHWEAAKRIVRYLLHTKEYGIEFTQYGKGIEGYAHNLAGFTDADFAGDVNDRKSTTGWVFTFNRSPISWASKKQGLVTRSSMESELVVGSIASAEGIWLIRLGKDFRLDFTPIPMFTDNQSFIMFSNSDISNSRTKHIDVHFHYTREQILAGIIKLHYIPSLDNPADILTKPLSPRKHVQLLSSLGVKHA